MASAAVLRELGHARTLRHVLTDQAVGVLAGAALPRVMRGREEEADACGTLELSVVVELGPWDSPISTDTVLG